MVAFPCPVPVTIPDVLTVATLMLLLLHVPPVTMSLKDIVFPAHSGVEPVIAAQGFTDTTVVAAQPDVIV